MGCERCGGDDPLADGSVVGQVAVGVADRLCNAIFAATFGRDDDGDGLAEPFTEYRDLGQFGVFRQGMFEPLGGDVASL